MNENDTTQQLEPILREAAANNIVVYGISSNDLGSTAAAGGAFEASSRGASERRVSVSDLNREAVLQQVYGSGGVFEPCSRRVAASRANGSGPRFDERAASERTQPASATMAAMKKPVRGLTRLEDRAGPHRLRPQSAPAAPSRRVQDGPEAKAGDFDLPADAQCERSSNRNRQARWHPRWHDR